MVPDGQEVGRGNHDVMITVGYVGKVPRNAGQLSKQPFGVSRSLPLSLPAPVTSARMGPCT